MGGVSGVSGVDLLETASSSDGVLRVSDGGVAATQSAGDRSRVRVRGNVRGASTAPMPSAEEGKANERGQP